MAHCERPEAIKIGTMNCQLKITVGTTLIYTAIKKITKPIVNPEKNSPKGNESKGKGPPAYKNPTAKQKIPKNKRIQPTRLTK